MKHLQISADLALPLRIVTEKLSFLGTTGSGKTYAATKMAELMWDAHAQFVALDPVGVWYGLRLGKDGKRPSDITVPIFGGLHGDLPLEPTAGALMANLIVDRGISVILDVSQFESDAQKARFAQEFADRFFFRKKAAPSAVHLFLEECQEFVPQNPQKGEERMLHAFTRLQKLGRNFGIGSSLISQRPQEVNKKALNMAQTLFVFRATGPQERKAIAGWIEAKGLDQDIAGDLPKLRTGDCHVWSPEFLGISEVVRIDEKRTFNASATPEVGAVAKSRELAPIDLEKIRGEMAATIERAKAEDPRELRKEIADLKKQLSSKASTVAAAPDQRLVDRAVAAAVRDAVKEHQVTIGELQKRLDRVGKLFARSFKVNEEIATELLVEVPKLPEIPSVTELPVPGSNSRVTVSYPPPRREMPVRTREAAPRSAGGNGRDHDGEIGKGERAILTVLAQYPHGKSRRNLGTLSGYSSSGGSFRTYLSRLRGKGYIEGSDPVRITEPGIAVLGDFEPLPTGEELQRYWLSRLGKGEAAILRVLIDHYPNIVPHEELGRLSGYEASGGSFRTYLSRLRTKELIDDRELRASEALFE
jgi:uncharacterized protein